MRILLIFPNSPITSEPCCSIYNPVKLPPYELLLSAANLRNKFDVKVLDAKAENYSINQTEELIRSHKPDMAVIWTTQLYHLKDIKILETAKKYKAITVLVMNEAILLKQILERFKYIDIAVNEGDKPAVLKEVAEAVTSKKGISKARGIIYRKGNRIIDNGMIGISDFSKLPMAAYDMAPMEKYYKGYIGIFSSRGCPFKCTFCFLGNTRWSGRSAEQVVDELELLNKKYGYKHMGFIDQLFTYSRQRVLDICSGIKKRNLKIRWICDSRVEFVDNELLKAMHDAGCRRIFYGVEHVSDEILKNVNKNQNKEKILKTIELTKKAGIKPAMSFIIGFPGESRKTINELMQFIIKAKPWQYAVVFPVPFPGTRLYQQAKENKWIVIEEKPENFYVEKAMTPVMVVPPWTAKSLLRARKKLILIPRLHPVILMNTLRDVYSRGGLAKLVGIAGSAYRIAAE